MSLQVHPRSPTDARRRRTEPTDLDPFAGDDEPWAEEDFLWSRDPDDHFAFLRLLWIAVFVSALFWVGLVVAGAGLVG